MATLDDTYCNCLYFTSGALARQLTKMAEEEFAATGLAPSYAFLLMSVNANPGITPTGLSKQMHLQPSTVTRLVEKMEARGYLERRLNGRNTEVYPLDTAIQLDVKLQKCWANLFRRYSDAIGADRSTSLTEEIHQAMNLLQ